MIKDRQFIPLYLFWTAQVNEQQVGKVNVRSTTVDKIKQQ